MTTFKIATWNVNSLRVRLPHVLTWLESAKPDVLALQETKVPDDDFPFAAIEEAGYQVVASGQRTYNGVAILSRIKAKDLVMDIPGQDDPQRRVLGATIGDVRVLNLYVPNGESVGSVKYGYKLGWLKNLQAYLQAELVKHPKFIILGDFNIAPADIDVHDPAAWAGKVLCSDLEREALAGITALGFNDCFRKLHPDTKTFSWWDYRMNGFKRNLGLRIDHILASYPLQCDRVSIDPEPRKWERPSDHTPVIAEFSL